MFDFTNYKPHEHKAAALLVTAHTTGADKDKLALASYMLDIIYTGDNFDFDLYYMANNRVKGMCGEMVDQFIECYRDWADALVVEHNAYTAADADTATPTREAGDQPWHKTLNCQSGSYTVTVPGNINENPTSETHGFTTGSYTGNALETQLGHKLAAQVVAQGHYTPEGEDYPEFYIERHR